MPETWQHHRGRVAALTRSRPENDPELVEARRNLKAARLEVRIASDLTTDPPFTDEQRARIAAPLVSVLGAPDELTCRRLLALLSSTAGPGDRGDV